MKFNYDIHIHTNLSSCANPDATVAGYVEQAQNTGLKVLGFADHLWDSKIPGVSKWYEPQNVEHVLQLKKEIPADGMMNGIRLLFGCETEFTCEGKLCLAEENMDLFDFILVPHSHTHMGVIVPRDWIADSSSHAKYLMDSFLALVNHPLSNRITSIAHPFIPGTNHLICDEVQSFIPDSYFREAFHAAKEKGIAIELNGSCFISKDEKDIPNCEYVRIYSIAKECGCKFTYGSDNHSIFSERKLPVIEQFLTQCGIENADFLCVEDFYRGMRKDVNLR